MYNSNFNTDFDDSDRNNLHNYRSRFTASRNGVSILPEEEMRMHREILKSYDSYSIS